MKKIIITLALLLAFNANAAKIQKQGIKTSAECIAAGATDATCLPEDTQIYVTANSINQKLSTAITNGLLGGGGGGSLFFVEGADSPIASLDSMNNRIYLYQSGLAQGLNTVIKVPASYGGGTQIKMYVQFYSPDSSGTALLQSIATLIRPGIDTFSSTTNQRTSTNSAVTLSAGTVNIPQTVTLDLTSSTGQINGVSVAANQIIYINLKRGTDTATSDLSALVYGAEVVTH